jgi:hypothetical protein
MRHMRFFAWNKLPKPLAKFVDCTAEHPLRMEVRFGVVMAVNMKAIVF